VGLPTVSVIIPTRDRPSLLLAAAQSVLDQRLPPTELLVVDDGASGGARTALHRLMVRSTIPLRLLPGPGLGPAAARNVGLSAAAGELIAFLDDDDLWLPDRLVSQVEWFARLPRLGLLGGHYLLIAEQGAPPRVRPVKPPRRPHPISRRALLRANRLATSTVLARRACFDDCGCFDETLTLAQDWDMWLRIAARWDVAVLPIPLAVYRIHPRQRSGRPAPMRSWEVQVLRRVVARAAAGDSWPPGLARRRLAWAHCRLGRQLLRDGRPAQALRQLKQSLSLFPLQPLAWGAALRSIAACRTLSEAHRT
jgi:glycosyltransferase involved in cell wall biosynthesis